MERARWATLVFCLLLLAQVVRAVRREHIRVEYSMAWFAAALVLLALTVWDTALIRLGAWLGVEDFPSLLLILAGLTFLFTFFRFSVELSTLKDHSILAAQKIALLEWEIRRQARELAGLRPSPQPDEAPPPDEPRDAA